MTGIASSDPYCATPEQQLVLMLLSQKPASEAAFRALANESDWERVLAITTLSLHPFLHFVLNENKLLDSIPRGARALLERAKADAVIRYMRRKTEMQRVLALFDDQGIETVVLKGASLAESVYPMPYLRPMQDVDLWIPEAQMSSAPSVLEANGYREKHVPSLEKDVRTGREIRLAKFFKYDLMVIELHATLDVHLPDEKLETDAIWNRCVPDPASRAKVLCARDVLYHLCTHLALRHRFEQGLLWLLDLRLFLEKHGPKVDWEELAEESRRQQTSKYIYLCLEMVADLFGSVVPPAVVAKFDRPADLRNVKSLAWRQLWYSNFAVLPPRRFLMLATTRPEERMGFLLHRLRKYPTSKSLEGRQPESWPQAAWTAVRWIASDLRKGYAAFRKGAFSRANLQRACEMELRRTEFERAMQA